jgi:hypothetical protein
MQFEVIGADNIVLYRLYLSRNVCMSACVCKRTCKLYYEGTCGIRVGRGSVALRTVLLILIHPLNYYMQDHCAPKHS